MIYPISFKNENFLREYISTDDTDKLELLLLLEHMIGHHEANESFTDSVDYINQVFEWFATTGYAKLVGDFLVQLNFARSKQDLQSTCKEFIGFLNNHKPFSATALNLLFRAYRSLGSIEMVKPTYYDQVFEIPMPETIKHQVESMNEILSENSSNNPLVISTVSDLILREWRDIN